MLPTTGFSRGNVVLVNFVFPNQEGVKRRPALIVSSPTYHRGRQEVILAAITSSARRPLPGDTTLQDWAAAGLLRPSVVTGVLRTVKASALARQTGTLVPSDLRSVEASLRLALGL